MDNMVDDSVKNEEVEEKKMKLEDEVKPSENEEGKGERKKRKLEVEVKPAENEEEKGESKKSKVEVEKPAEIVDDFSDPPATECSLWDWMERFDFPPSPPKPKPLSEMTDLETFHFITGLIHHEIERDRFKNHHRKIWFRRNNIDPYAEDFPEQVLKLDEERSIRVHSTSATCKQTEA
jgi:hypothetical protein